MNILQKAISDIKPYNRNPRKKKNIQKVANSIKEFGFEIRKESELKHGVHFNIERKIQYLDIECKQEVSVDDPNLDEKINQVNQEFQQEATFFVARHGGHFA